MILQLKMMILRLKMMMFVTGPNGVGYQGAECHYWLIGNDIIDMNVVEYQGDFYSHWYSLKERSVFIHKIKMKNLTIENQDSSIEQVWCYRPTNEVHQAIQQVSAIIDEILRWKITKIHFNWKYAEDSSHENEDSCLEKWWDLWKQLSIRIPVEDRSLITGKGIIEHSWNAIIDWLETAFLSNFRVCLTRRGVVVTQATVWWQHGSGWDCGETVVQQVILSVYTPGNRSIYGITFPFSTMWFWV